jgi:ribosomal protein S18 acetylase RimI-like enzyme
MIPVLAGAADAEELGRMHVQSWRETYAGLVPQSFLDGLDPVARGERWRGIIESGCRLFLVRDALGLAGFGSCGAQREQSLPFGGEITALYVLRRAQRQGIGRMLMGVLGRDLEAAGHKGVALWVMAGNEPACRFYEAMGGRVVAARDADTHAGIETRSIAYGWRDVARLSNL